jgi:hypothetical protein
MIIVLITYFCLCLYRKLGHDYLFFANLKSYDAPWLRLCSAVESAIGNPKLYNTGKSHGGIAPKKGQTKFENKVKNKTHQATNTLKDT